jgi:hypothetical protein
MIRQFLTASAFSIYLTGCGEETEPAARSAPKPPSAGQTRMLAELRKIGETTKTENPWLGDGMVRSLREELEFNNAIADPAARMRSLFNLGIAELNLGKIDESIQRLEECAAIIESAGAGGDIRNRVLIAVGTAYLRKGETENCCLRNAPESCILPLRGKAIHTETEGSEKAITFFQKVLENGGDDFYRQAKAKWLLNLAYMTLGRYPDAVPPAYLIDQSVFDSDEEFPGFPNIATKLGVNSFNLAGGLIVDDFDGDSDLDMVASTLDPSEAPRYFSNDGSGKFTERSKAAGFEGLFGGLNLVQADYDNDGDIDILVLRGAWFGPGGRHPNSLLENDGRGVFRDVTFESGLGEVHFPTQTAAWADYDNDGDLDLYIGNESSARVNAPCQLFRNDGRATADSPVRFTDVARDAGVAAVGLIKAVAWGDYDHDRLPDIAVSNHSGPNWLFHNNGDGTFTDVATMAGVDKPHRSFPLWFWDFNNDGRLDLFIASFAARIGDVVHYIESGNSRVELPGHYRGDGHGNFKNVAGEQGFDYPLLPMGSNFGDLNNDGFLDVYLGTGEPAISVILPNLMFLNKGGAKFVDVTMAGGFGHLQKGHAVCFADFDEDGDQDVFEQLGGAKPVDRYHNALFENPGFGNSWIKIKLIGEPSNRSGIGARIHVVVSHDGVERSIYRHVNSGGSFGANPLVQHIGLGKNPELKSLAIYWPTTNTTQTFTDIPAQRQIVIQEGDGRMVILRSQRR